MRDGTGHEERVLMDFSRICGFNRIPRLTRRSKIKSSGKRWGRSHFQKPKIIAAVRSIRTDDGALSCGVPILVIQNAGVGSRGCDYLHLQSLFFGRARLTFQSWVLDSTSKRHGSLSYIAKFILPITLASAYLPQKD